MATNEILQIVIFSIFFGVAAAAMGEKSKGLIKAFDAASHIILKMVGYVMNFAPLGVFGALAAVIATKGLSVFVFYIKYFLYFLTGIGILWMVLIGVGFIILGKRMPSLIKIISNHTKQRNQFCILIFLNFSFMTKATNNTSSYGSFGGVGAETNIAKRQTQGIAAIAAQRSVSTTVLPTYSSVVCPSYLDTEGEVR
jgi:L-cystine uptake protein TcyP (sodium:dicarboxylate symporter family)